MAKLKVYSGNYNGRVERAVAASSQTQAAKLIGVSTYEFRRFYGEQAPDETILSAPGRVFERPMDSRSPWRAI